MTERTTSKAGAKKPRKLTIDVDMETLEQTFTTEGFTGRVDCREFSKRFEDLAGAASSKDEDTPEASKKPEIFRNA